MLASKYSIKKQSESLQALKKQHLLQFCEREINTLTSLQTKLWMHNFLSIKWMNLSKYLSGKL